MENKNDKELLLEQMEQLKIYADKIQDCLSEVELLIVDNNNSRIKDPSLKNNIEDLSEQINFIYSSIDAIERNLE